MKHQLRDYVLATVNDPREKWLTPEEFESSLRSRLRDAGVDSQSANDYKGILEILIRTPSGHTDLLTVETTLGIPYGRDCSLYVVQRAGEQWKLVFGLEGTGYKQVTEAPSSFAFHVSPA